MRHPMEARSVAEQQSGADVSIGSAAPEVGPSAPSPSSTQAAVALSLLILLLVLATSSQGGFATSRWAPVALFALAVQLGALVFRGGRRRYSRPVWMALAGIWGLAGLSMLSMSWAQSSGRAFAAGDRMLLYAATFTLPFVLPLSRRLLAAAGWAITVGIGAIAVYTTVRLLVDGEAIFLAGRLNGPVNYRNATALLFAIPVWPAVVLAAARRYRRGTRAAALGLGTLCLGLSFLTESRGVLIGLVLGGVIVLWLGPDRIRRAWIAALMVAAVAIAAHWLLRPYHAFDGGRGFVTAHEIAVAGVALVIATGVAFLIGLGIALFDNGLRADSSQMRRIRLTARVALALGAVALVIGGLVAVGNPATYLSRKWDEFRTLQSTTPTGPRLLSTNGQRYDLWRVAVKEFEHDPVAGVGADNYVFGYYRMRATNRNLTDPHSLIFGLLSETGIVGLALFGLFLAGLVAVIRGGWGALSAAQRRPAAAALAAGVVMLGQSMVDWMWLIPGLTSLGILALGAAAAQVAAGPPRGEDSGAGEGSRAGPHPNAPGAISPGGGAARRARYLATGGRVIAVGTTALALVAVLALLLSNAYIQRARSDIGHPAAELSAARAAAELDPWLVTAHYLEASAYESRGQRGAAYAQLLDALSLEPQNSATLGVLGDFETRGRHYAAAQAYYRRALALNPLDAGLQRLARLRPPGH